MISILIPSLLKKYSTDKGQRYLLQRAVESIARQTLIISGTARAQIIVGIDPGTHFPTDLPKELGAEFVTSRGRWAAAALNAAAERIEGDYVSILEDDDQWEPQFLEIALPFAESGAFVSSSQLEVDPKGKPIRVVDYPAPSGWVMKRDVWSSVGVFNEEYRWHHDTEWIGRLNKTKHSRVHLVEAMAPEFSKLRISFLDRLLGRRRQKRERAGLLRLAKTNDRLRVCRQSSGHLLVTRLAHDESGHALIRRENQAGRQSDDEKARLVRRFGGIPW